MCGKRKSTAGKSPGQRTAVLKAQQPGDQHELHALVSNVGDDSAHPASPAHVRIWESGAVEWLVAVEGVYTKRRDVRGNRQQQLLQIS